MERWNFPQLVYILLRMYHIVSMKAGSMPQDRRNIINPDRVIPHPDFANMANPPPIHFVRRIERVFLHAWSWSRERRNLGRNGLMARRRLEETVMRITRGWHGHTRLTIRTILPLSAWPGCPAPNMPRPISAPPHLSPLPIAMLRAACFCRMEHTEPGGSHENRG